MTLYRNFASKNDLAIAFLTLREERDLRAREGGGRRRSRAVLRALAHFMKGSIVAAHEGDAEAAMKAREMGMLLLAREGAAPSGS